MVSAGIPRYRSRRYEWGSDLLVKLEPRLSAAPLVEQAERKIPQAIVLEEKSRRNSFAEQEIKVETGSENAAFSFWAYMGSERYPTSYVIAAYAIVLFLGIGLVGQLITSSFIVFLFIPLGLGVWSVLYWRMLAFDKHHPEF
jgi:hypothetical protein